MADIKVFRLTAIGPATKYEAVDSASVVLDANPATYKAKGQGFAPIAAFQLVVERPITFSKTNVDISAPAVITALGLYYKAFADTGGEGAAGISVVGDALLIPLSVSASKGQPAKTSLRALFMAAPVIGTTAGAMAGITHMYRLGPTTFNGAALAGIEQQSLDFGLVVRTNAGQSGNIYPTVWWIEENAPVATIQTTDLNVVGPYLAGAQIDTSALALKFQDETGSAGYVYTIGKAYVEGSINGGMGTLKISALSAATIMSGATY